MANKVEKTKKMKYMNEFPIIIMIAIAVIVIVLTVMYLNIKPYGTINRNGYMVLSNNMTYNLISSNFIEEEKDEFDVGVASVSTGDYIYKQMGTYYVGVEKKQEIDYDYPLYSPDGLTIYNQKEDVILIDRNFEKLKGYAGLSLNYGILYNDGDPEPADDVDYLFLYLNNSVYINAQTMVIKTVSNEYTIAMHSPIYFDTEYINYYAFNGKKFEYNNITDIYSDSLIKIGDVTLTYNEFMIQMGLIEITEKEDEEPNKENNEKIEEDEEIEKVEYIKPTVSVLDFIPSVYYMTSELIINDPSGVITSNPTFEIYTMDDKLYSRKKFSSSGEIKISGLSSNTQYKIVGTYKYTNEFDLSIVSTFYEGIITTKDVSALEEIKIVSELGDIYPNKIEIKNLNITNFNAESVLGIKKIVLEVTKENADEVKKINLTYSQIRYLMNGEKVTIFSSNNLESNTVYEYQIRFYDKDDNELKVSGDVSGTVKTSKAIPDVKISSNIDKKNNVVEITMQTKNPDNVYIKDFKYELYSYSGYLVKDGILDYDDENITELIFDDLDYNVNYILRITGIYDLEDGKGEMELLIESNFTTSTLNTFTAWYDINTLEVTKDSINAEIGINKSTAALEMPTTEVIVYLVDKDGNDILDENGELMFSKKYTKDEYTSDEHAYYYINSTFEGLESATEYNIKIKINVQQLEKNITLEKMLTPSITTLLADAYINVINKKLIGDNLDVTLEIVDPDGLTNPEGVIVEIYNRKLTSREEIEPNETYIYRNKYMLDDKNIISLSLYGYTEDNYTIFISSNPYNKESVVKYLDVKESDDTFTKVINLDRMISARVEMHEQQSNEDTKTNSDYNYVTKIGISYDLYETIADVYLIDCVDGKCTTLGYMDSEQDTYQISERYVSSEIINGKKVISVLNKKEDKQHTFYLAIEKRNVNLNDTVVFYESSINNNIYVLAKLEYNTGHKIYNIDNASDFLDSKLIKRSGETNHYVVTENITFGDGINFHQNVINSSHRISNFNGEIDFQGYQVDLYQNSSSMVYLFYTISASGILKNAVLNYNLNYSGVVSDIYGFIYTNYGTLENFIVNVKQSDPRGRVNAMGLLAYYNYNLIDNFVIYLKSDIHTYGTTSLVTYRNGTDRGLGFLKNGYISTDSNSITSYKIILHDTTSNYGTFSNANYGTIKNVYNLVDIELAESSYSGSGIVAMTRENKQSGTIKNTISVATTKQIANTNAMNGPSIAVNRGIASNNYYVDTNKNNVTYSGSFNKRINIATLMNKNSWEIIINGDDDFSIVDGYYPTLKMNDFMSGYQNLIPIIGEQIGESKIDVWSAEAIYNNMGDNQRGKIKVYVSNPQKYEITGIVVEDLTSTINETETYYDESSQATVVILDLDLNEDDKAKSIYHIVSISYLDDLGGEHTKEYSENNFRTFEIEMYRRVREYNVLIDSINNNENIFLLNDIISSKTETSIPNATTYSAIFDGNEKTLDLNNKSINKGYFIYNTTGTIKNLQIVNMFLCPNNSAYIGFIRQASGATISNIDISDSNIEIVSNDEGYNAVYVGGVVSYADSTLIDKVSTNNLIIKKADEYYSVLRGIYIGGIVGFLNYSQLNNSYSYNLNINNMYSDYPYGDSGIGAIAGGTNQGHITSCYATGAIDTEYSGMGGIAGAVKSSHIKNNYSYMNLIGSGDYAGGIVGILNESNSYAQGIVDNMFIGQLINKYSNFNYSLISPVANRNKATRNYSLVNEMDFSAVTQITDLNKMNAFDLNYNSFSENLEEKDLPYLNSTSFVKQEIIGEMFVELSKIINYTVTYKTNENSACQINTNIKNVNNDSENISSDLYTNACADYAVLELDSDYTLEYIEDLIKESEEDGSSYILRPNELYSNYYDATIVKKSTGEKIKVLLNIPFYKKISSQADWNSLSTDKYTNIILTNNLELKADSDDSINNQTYKKLINNFLGNGFQVFGTVDDDSKLFSSVLISELKGIMRDVKFNSISLSSEGLERLGIIYVNNGTIENVSFQNIAIQNKGNLTAIVSINNGFVRNINLDNISVIGDGWVAGLVAYSENSSTLSRVHVSDVYGTSIVIKGSKCLGSIAGRVEYLLKNINVENIDIGQIDDARYSGAYIGGIVGVGDCVDCSVKHAKIAAAGSHIGGIGGYRGTGRTLSSTIDDVVIYEFKPGIIYVGGLYGAATYYSNSQVNNLIIAKNIGTTEDPIYVPMNANYVGGVVAAGIVSVSNSTVTNSYISGTNYVGGIYGTNTGTVENSFSNLVLNTTIEASNNNAGGLFGIYTPNNATPRIHNNIVMKSQILGKANVGGIVGNLNNNNTFSQNTEFKGNLVIDVQISSNTSSDGGLIGTLYQVPSSSDIKYSQSLFYGNTESGSLIGKINYNNTGASTGYGQNELTNDEFAELSGFKEYVGNEILQKNYQINSVNDLTSIIQSRPFIIPYKDGNYYFPVFNRSDHLQISEEDYVPIPYDAGTGTRTNVSMLAFSSRRMLRNYSNAYNNAIDIEYDVYTSGVNKVNIEFSDIDPSIYFYYSIGDYVSNAIPIDNRVYTITYDFKAPIELYVTNGFNYKNSTIKATELAKTVSIINGETYYLNSGMLYSETKAIVGQFNNLYGTETLTSDGKIYSIVNNQEYDANIDYNVLESAISLYETVYKENTIKTYYNFSTVNGVVKEFQLFVKNGNLNFINGSLDNKKDMYIIDYYNNNEIQIILKNDGKLYSVKHNINYPDDIVNNQINELYTNINSSDNIVTLKYENGAVYTFDYRTGKLIFTNVSNEYSSFLDYVKDKVGASSKYNVIENISGYDKYSEIELLKNKFADVSIEEANDKIYSTNNSLNTNENYITAYNEVTQNYDVYKVSSILNNSVELESETNKLYSNYELVKFYKTLGQSKNKNSLSGITIFAISIISVLVSLILLVRHRKNKKGGAI